MNDALSPLRSRTRASETPTLRAGGATGPSDFFHGGAGGQEVPFLPNYFSVDQCIYRSLYTSFLKDILIFMSFSTSLYEGVFSDVVDSLIQETSGGKPPNPYINVL